MRRTRTRCAALRCAPLVHEHCLFSDALLESSNVLRLLSARGSQVGGASGSAEAALSLGGDLLLDHARTCQSLLGFDEDAFGLWRAPDGYRKMLVVAFVEQLRARGFVPLHVLALALHGFVTSIGELDPKRRAEVYTISRGDCAAIGGGCAGRAALAALFVGHGCTCLHHFMLSRHRSP